MRACVRCKKATEQERAATTQASRTLLSRTEGAASTIHDATRYTIHDARCRKTERCTEGEGRRGMNQKAQQRAMWPKICLAQTPMFA